MNKRINKKKKQRRIKFKNIILVLLIGVILFGSYKLLDRNITNIYVVGNSIYNDQEIIDLANLDDYPKIFEINNGKIEKQLAQDLYIIKAHISKNIINRSVTISIDENIPLFYYDYKNTTILKDGSTTEEYFSVPTLINQVPDSIYEKFISKISLVNSEILIRISEIRYDPNDVDSERFLFTMNDGNYVYINISKFEMINKYIDIIKNFDNKKGFLYLDSGEYFDIYDE